MLNKYKYKIYEFMRGRYGIDTLGRRIQILTIIFLVISLILRLSGLGAYNTFNYLALIGILIYTYRMMSKNRTRMALQNQKYLALEKNFLSSLQKIKRRLSFDKDYKYFSCPVCKTELRLPKGKGKLRVICPKCKNEFIKRT